MATFDYAKMATTAGRLLTKFGQTITITRNSGGSVDPVTGAVTAGTNTEYSPKGILQKYPDHLIDGTRILASDRMLILDDTIEPQPDDDVTVDGSQWQIVSLNKSSPAGTDIVYFVQVRK